MRLFPRETRPSAVLVFGALLASLCACWDVPTGPDHGPLPCFACLVTTELRIDGIAPVAVGDTLRLRAIAYQQNVVFYYRLIPSRTASWTVTSGDSGRVTVVVPRATADTATWGHALLIARAPGTVLVEAREDGITTTRPVTILPAAPLEVTLRLRR